VKERNIDQVVRGTATMQMLGAVGWSLAGAVILWAISGDAQEKFSTGRWWEVVIPGLFGGLMVLFALSAFSDGWRRRGHPDEHPALKCPAYGTTAQVRHALQEALNTSRKVCVVDVEVTDEWLLNVGRWEVRVIYLPMVAWYYKRVTEHKRYWVTTDVKYDFVLHTTDGQSFTRDDLSDAQVDRLMELVSERAPAAIGGYSEQAQSLWSNDRAGFVKTVAERRASLELEARSHRTVCEP